MCNVALDSVIFDMFGKSPSAITIYLVTSDSFDPDTCKAFLLRSLKTKANAVVESIEGYQMKNSHKERILLVRSHMEFIGKTLQTLDSRLDELVAPYEAAISLLCTIPRVDGGPPSPSSPRLALICLDLILPIAWAAGRA